MDPPRWASAEDLPDELLTKIFHFMQDDSATQFHEPPRDDPFDKQWFLRPDFMSPRFPGAAAQVSSRWRSIITSIPEFWTILVCALDTSRPISLLGIQTSLDRGLSLPLDIVVTRRPGSREPTADEERLHLTPLVALLTPYFVRCRSIYFYTIHSSALPKLGGDLIGTLPNLAELKLECKTDNDFHADVPLGWDPVTCPALHTLVIGGSNFRNTWNTQHDWPLHFPCLKALSLVRLSPSPHAIALYDFLDVLSGVLMHLDFLRLCDVELTNPFSEEYRVGLNLGRALVLEDLPRSFVLEFTISLALSAPELHVARCALNAMGRLPATAALRLEDISVHDNLAEHLRTWYGSDLTLVRCEGLDDDFLDMLGRVSTYSGAPNLVRLTIVDCMGFTVGALQGMVEARKKAKKGAIEDLVVTGTGPVLDTLGVSALRDQLKSLEWNTS